MNEFKNIERTLQDNAIGSAAYWGYSIGRKLVESYINNTKPGFKNLQVYDDADAERGGVFGLPVYSTVHFGRVSETEKPIEWRRVNQLEKLPMLTLECVLMTINGSKSIVKTEVAGQRKIGSVKEFMGYNDYQVRLSGVLFSPHNEIEKYPMKQVNDLRRICEAPIAVPVLNTLLNRMGIMNLVIEDFSFPPYPGKENVQPFELSCVSDMPLALNIKGKSDAYGRESIYAGDRF